MSAYDPDPVMEKAIAAIRRVMDVEEITDVSVPRDFWDEQQEGLSWDGEEAS